MLYVLQYEHKTMRKNTDINKIRTRIPTANAYQKLFSNIKKLSIYIYILFYLFPLFNNVF